MNVGQINQALNALAPLHYAESFDNVGLLTGETDWEVTGILVSLDCLEQTVQEAVTKGCNMIVSFHPIIFNGLKNLRPDDYVKRTVTHAIKNDIAIYAIHTALDNAFNGVSYRMATALNLVNVKTLIPRNEIIKKLQCYVPLKDHDRVRDALFETGAGQLGNYSECSFSAQGSGTFKGNDLSNPQLGKKNIRETAREQLLSVTYLPHLEKNIINALYRSHPYEEVAYEIITLENSYQRIGMGAIGTLDSSMDNQTFLKRIKEVFRTGVIKHSLSRKRTIEKVALLGGSGAFGIKNAKAQGADAYITADLKYHDFFQGEDILLCDVGHFESEQFTIDLLHDFLSSKFRNIAIFCAETQTNPVNYF